MTDNNGRSCSKCRKYKPLADFHRSKTHRLGVTPRCKECRRMFDRKHMDAYIERNKDKLNAKRRTHYWENRESELLRNREWFKEQSAGIYLIECVPTGKVYIGQSKTVSTRLRRHQSDLIRGQHRNSWLQFDYGAFGLESFTFRVFEEYPSDTKSITLLVREDELIEQFCVDGRELYNVRISEHTQL
jgi:hypothetical protein